MGATISIKVDDHGYVDRLRRKGNEVDRRIELFMKQITLAAQRWVQNEAPHGKTGNLKMSILQRADGKKGQVWHEDTFAPYGKWVIEGHDTLTTDKQRRWWFWYLNSKLNGNYKRKTDGEPGHAGENDFFERALPHIENNIEAELRILGKWMETL